MENLIQAIRLAASRGASTRTRCAGASACRAILATIENAAEPPLPLADTGVAWALARVELDALLDVALARLHATNTRRTIRRRGTPRQGARSRGE